MSTAVAPRAVVTGRDAAPPARPHLSFPGVMRGEWIKLLSLRSTWWSLGATVVVMTLFALGQALSLESMAAVPETAAVLTEIHGAEIVSAGYPMGVVTIAVLGTLLITGEYSTGMIRSTLTAVPTRLPVLAAKGIALVVLTLVVGAVSLALSFVVTAPLLTEHGLVPSLADPQTWQVFGGMAYFLVAAALFALGTGTLLRSTAGSVTVALTILLLLPGFLGFITLGWVETLVSYLPMPAAAAFLTVSEMTLGEQSDLSTWAGVLVVAAYGVVPLAVAGVMLRRRDA